MAGNNICVYISGLFFYEGLILWFQVVMLRKIGDVTSVDLLLWRIDFIILCCSVMDVWSWPISSELWPWINFMTFYWNVIIGSRTNTWTWLWIVFKISNWNVVEIIWTWFWLILPFKVYMLRELVELDPGIFNNFKLKIKDVAVDP